MRIDIHCLTDGSRGELEQGRFGDAVERACAYSALTGQTDLEDCPAVGWPRWLAEVLIVVFDNAPLGARARTRHWLCRSSEGC